MPTDIRLYCSLCDIVDCPFRAYYVSYDSDEGCIRTLDDDTYIRYYHFVNEILPFSHMKPLSRWMDNQCINFINFMNEEVSYAPLAHKLNEYGRPEIADH